MGLGKMLVAGGRLSNSRPNTDLFAVRKTQETRVDMWYVCDNIYAVEVWTSTEKYNTIEFILSKN